MKCVARKPVKDGPCSKDKHEECLESQYCSAKDNTLKCRDRKCSGICTKDAHCTSNKCTILFCKEPANGCKNIDTTTTKAKPKRFLYDMY